MKTNFNFDRFPDDEQCPGSDVQPDVQLRSEIRSAGVDSLRLSELEPGRDATVDWVEGTRPEDLRLAELGLLPDTPIKAVRRAPLGDPTEFELRGYRLCLRRREAERVRVRLNGKPRGSPRGSG